MFNNIYQVVKSKFRGDSTNEEDLEISKSQNIEASITEIENRLSNDPTSFSSKPSELNMVTNNSKVNNVKLKSKFCRSFY